MSKKILVVDDNADFTYIVKKRLEKLASEYTVISAHSGKECLDLLHNGAVPDLILLDVMMPEMNGWDVFAKIKEHQTWRNVPVIFLTAKTDIYSKGFGKIAACEYIEKPFEITELRMIIEKTLAREKPWSP